MISMANIYTMTQVYILLITLARIYNSLCMGCYELTNHWNTQIQPLPSGHACWHRGGAMAALPFSLKHLYIVNDL